MDSFSVCCKCCKHASSCLVCEQATIWHCLAVGYGLVDSHAVNLVLSLAKLLDAGVYMTVCLLESLVRNSILCVLLYDL
jgi:hypothetical protein